MIIIFSGPSGVGKSTIINELINHMVLTIFLLTKLNLIILLVKTFLLSMKDMALIFMELVKIS